MGLDLAESMRLQAVDALANIRTRRIVVGYLPRNTATLVTNSWRSAKNQQTTRVKCRNGVTDAAVIALATHCPSLKSMNLVYCSNITDAHVSPHVHVMLWSRKAGGIKTSAGNDTSVPSQICPLCARVALDVGCDRFGEASQTPPES